MLALFLFAACEETIELDLKQTDEVFIIEGSVSSQDTFHTIKITKTVPFGASGQTPRVSDALVTVTDEEGTVFRFEEVEAGLYRSEEAFAGKAGMTYTLRVEVDDRLFIASEKLNPAVGFERLEIALDEDEQEDPEDEGRFYDVLFYAFEPQETEDFYLFKFFRNGEQENGDGAFAAVTNDVGLAGKIEGFPLGVYYALDDTARVEMYNISRQAYRYYLDLNNNIGNDGGMFSGQPANVGTNIEGGALGYFRVAGLAAAEIVVE